MGRNSRKKKQRANWRAYCHNQISKTGEGHADGEEETAVGSGEGHVDGEVETVGTVVSAHWRRGQSLVSSSHNYVTSLLLFYYLHRRTQLLHLP